MKTGWGIVLGLVAAGTLYYFVLRYQATMAKNDDQAGGIGIYAPAIATSVQTWSQTYGIDSTLVYAIILTENSFTPSGGAYPAGDGGTSHGPMQVHRGGAIDAFESANSVSVDDSTLDAVGSDLAIQIGVWNLAQCLQAAGGSAQGAFRRYNGSGPLAVAYSARALANYSGLVAAA